jgi:hypothetical protein
MDSTLITTWGLVVFTGVLAWTTYKLYKSSNRQFEVLEKQLKITITQLKINALQASIEAEKMKSLEKTEGSRGEYVTKIHGIGNEMQRMINELE